MARARWVCFMVIALCGLGCEEDAEPTERRSCDEVAGFAGQQVSERIARFAPGCVSNDDCGVIGFTGRCGEAGRYTTDLMPFSLSQREALEAAFVDDNDLLCRTFDGCNRSFTLDTFVRFAYCDDGVCRGTYTGPDQACPALVRELESWVEIAVGEPDAFLPCASVDDCVLQSVEMTCAEGHHLVSCPVPLHKDALSTTLPAYLERFNQERCTERVFTCDAVGDDCDEGPLECASDGRCVLGRSATD